jgi:hypothetical protein
MGSTISEFPRVPAQDQTLWLRGQVLWLRGHGSGVRSCSPAPGPEVDRESKGGRDSLRPVGLASGRGSLLLSGRVAGRGLARCVQNVTRIEFVVTDVTKDPGLVGTGFSHRPGHGIVFDRDRPHRSEETGPELFAPMRSNQKLADRAPPVPEGAAGARGIPPGKDRMLSSGDRS